MFCRSQAHLRAVTASTVLRQFAGAGGGSTSGGSSGTGRTGRSHRRFDDGFTSTSGGSGNHHGTGAAADTNDDTVEGFFGALKKRFAEFELNKDRKLDADAQTEEAMHRRSMLGLDDADGGGSGHAATHGRGSVEEREGKVGQPLHIRENPNACPRSVLFSPGSKPRAMHKILELQADCFILDLEDSVGPSMKREARDHVRTFVMELDEKKKKLAGALNAAEASALNKRLIVRINSPDFDPTNAMLDLELVGLLGESIEGVAIPKVTRQTHELIRDYVHPEHHLWAFFESPLSILQAPEICLSGHYRYAVMGFNDLSNELQLPVSATSGDRLVGGKDSFLVRDLTETERATARLTARLPLLHSAMQVLLAARAANMHVLDAVFNDPTDAVGFRRELLTCRSLGFDGKTLIHPSQIAPTNAAFTPTAAEVEWAVRVKQALANAHGGVATVDGKMVEDLHVRQATHTLTLHRAAEAEKEAQENEQA